MKAVICVSDLHVGSLVGLCPPGARQDGGAPAGLNKFQETLWEDWTDFWNVFVPKVTQHAESKVVVVNGDIIDGNHHDTVAVWTNNVDTQGAAAEKVLKPISEKYRMFLTRGTEAHSGPGSVAEESIARYLELEPNEVGDRSVYQLWLDVDGVSFQFAHHIGVTSSAAYETSAPMRELVAGMVEASQWGMPMPRVVVRSHRHRYVPVEIPSIAGDIRCIITPGWQCKTPFTERIDRMRMPHIGGVVFVVEDGECLVKKKMYPLPEPEPIKI